eukprot:5920774-Amphidinium_carterae.1
MENVDVLEEVLGQVGVVELVVPDVKVEHDELILEDVLVNVDVVELGVLGDDTTEFIDADVV